MSVLIRGMDEIPEDGSVLVAKHDDNGKVYIKYAGIMGYSMELERIPERHGRLFDSDEVKKVLDDLPDSEDKWSAIALLEWAIEKRWCIEAEGAEE